MTRARAKKVNDALIQFMTKPMRAREQLRENELRLVILIQIHEDCMSCRFAVTQFHVFN